MNLQASSLTSTSGNLGKIGVNTAHQKSMGANHSNFAVGGSKMIKPAQRNSLTIQASKKEEFTISMSLNDSQLQNQERSNSIHSVTHNYSKVQPVIKHEPPVLQPVPEDAGAASTKYSGINFAKPSMKSSLMYGFGGGSKMNQAPRGNLMTMRASLNDTNNETADEIIDIEVEDSSAEVKEEKKPVFKPVYAYFVLGLVLVCRIMVQWHRQSLQYAYGYTGIGLLANNPIYEIGTAYPEMAAWFGLLTGLIYGLPYAGFGLVAGQISDKVNRKLFLGIVVILASLCMGATGFSSSFGVLVVMRVLHGMLNAASNPLSFSLITDYFPKEKRATANSLIQAGNYVGVGFSSLTILLITKFGWRISFGIMAVIGSAFGAATMAFVGEPERGRYLDEETKKKELEKKEAEAKAALENKESGIASFFKNLAVVFKLPTAKNVLIASSMRNFGGIIIAAYLPVFFGKNFPTFKAEYALLNAIGVSCCGLIASLSGGILADKFESKSYMTKAIICMVGCALSFPLVALGTLQTSNFYLALGCYALKVLVSGTYSGPAITMIQNTSPLSQQGNVISVYFFCITFAQIVGPAIFNVFVNSYGCLQNPALYGPLITASIGISYVGSLPFWYKAGREYEKFMVEQDKQEADAQEGGQGQIATA